MGDTVQRTCIPTERQQHDCVELSDGFEIRACAPVHASSCRAAAAPAAAWWLDCAQSTVVRSRCEAAAVACRWAAGQCVVLWRATDDLLAPNRRGRNTEITR